MRIHEEESKFIEGWRPGAKNYFKLSLEELSIKPFNLDIKLVQLLKETEHVSDIEIKDEGILFYIHDGTLEHLHDTQCHADQGRL